jgi:hypothetical protein
MVSVLVVLKSLLRLSAWSHVGFELQTRIGQLKLSGFARPRRWGMMPARAP